MTLQSRSLRQQVEAHKVLPLPGATVTISIAEAQRVVAELDRLRERVRELSAREGSDAPASTRNPTCERCKPYPGDPCVCGWDT